MTNERVLQLLSKEYPTIDAAASEIINLSAILHLPKGTEYFFSDIHGEYSAFAHLVRSASGSIREKIQMVFENYLSEDDLNEMAHLIYDPIVVLNTMELEDQLTDEFLRIRIFQLVELSKFVASKYSRRKVRSKFPKAYVEILDELMHVDYDEFNKKAYYRTIIDTIIQTGTAKKFLIELCYLIQNISVDALHVIGDIYDRGAHPDLVMDTMMEFPNVDIQWGNHDIAWMGAACGNETLIAIVIRNGLMYNTFDFLEDGYGINLRVLSEFASATYEGDPCACFSTKQLEPTKYDTTTPELSSKMAKAIAVIQFKLAGQIIERHPEYGMDDRNVLKNINYETMEYVVGGKSYPMKDKYFPTIDPKNPLKLTKGEQNTIDALKASFLHSEPLHRHVRYLYAKGASYKMVNSNLLFHGCIPMTEDGEFDSLTFKGKSYSGKDLMDYLDKQIRNAYFLGQRARGKRDAVDLMWYLWTGAKSPMFGKSKMVTFENYFVDAKEIRKEIYNPYFKLSQRPEICDKIFNEFSMNPDTSHIINGHVPVKIKDGESPVKAGGKLYVIDGGISKAYQPKTGIAGYTLIFNSHSLSLAEHRSFEKIMDDISAYTPTLTVSEHMPERLLVMDTDDGKEIQAHIDDLLALIDAYRSGDMKEQGGQSADFSAV